MLATKAMPHEPLVSHAPQDFTLPSHLLACRVQLGPAAPLDRPFAHEMYLNIIIEVVNF